MERSIQHGVKPRNRDTSSTIMEKSINLLGIWRPVNNQVLTHGMAETGGSLEIEIVCAVSVLRKKPEEVKDVSGSHGEQ